MLSSSVVRAANASSGGDGWELAMDQLLEIDGTAALTTPATAPPHLPTD
jgi:hypothetical protein